MGLLDGAVEQLKLVQGQLFPAALGKNVGHFLAHLREHFGVLGEGQERDFGEIGSGVNGGHGQGQLQHRGVVLATFGNLLQPFKSVVGANESGLVASCTSGFHDWFNDGLGLVSGFAQVSARLEEKVGNGLQRFRPFAKLAGRLEEGDSVVDGNIEPFLVADEFLAVIKN